VRTPSLGTVTFPLVRAYVDDMQTVTEEAIAEAVRFLFYRLKIVVEPSGALGVAALLSRAVTPRDPVGVILSGGNVDGAAMADILGDTTCLRAVRDGDAVRLEKAAGPAQISTAFSDP
jgi:threonine dehydratase